MEKIINSDDYPEMHNLNLNWVTWYSIGFADIKETDATICGSGTLVSAGDNYAILTADHVVEFIKKRQNIGIILLTSEKKLLHKYMLNTQHVNFVTVGKASNSNQGPDLGYLQLLSNHDVESLKARKNFYSLDKHREKILTTPPTIQTPGWSISGMVDEWTKDEEPIRGYQRVKLFKGFCYHGEVTKESRSGEFDYLNFESKFEESYDGPISYEGMSGGGLWHISYKQGKNNMEINEGTLSGVIFYQSDFIDGINTIYCHGRESIYEKVYKELITD